MRDDYDVVVVGAGPAGGTAAAVTAIGGYKTLLVEREAFPRFHVGESLMPEAYWPLERIGLNDRVREAGWQIKKSVQFVTGNGKESTPFFFVPTTIAIVPTPGRWNAASLTKCCSIERPNAVPIVTIERG